VRATSLPTSRRCCGATLQTSTRTPELFFANTYPTKGIKNVLKLVALRVSGRPDQIGAIFRLDTQFGGGKTHTLIASRTPCAALMAWRTPTSFSMPPCARHRCALPPLMAKTPTRPTGAGWRHLRAFSPWGELAYALRGEAGYRLVERATAKESRRVPTPCAS
jgi:hypothetical protein